MLRTVRDYNHLRLKFIFMTKLTYSEVYESKITIRIYSEKRRSLVEATEIRHS